MKYILTLILCLGLIGCQNQEIDTDAGSSADLIRSTETLKTVDQELKTSNQSIKNATVEIVESANKIESIATNVGTPNLTQAWVDKAVTALSYIIVEAQKIQELTRDLQIAQTEIAASTKKIEEVNIAVLKQTTKIATLEQENASLNSENQKIQAEALKQVYDYVGALFGIGFLLVIAGAIVSFYNKKIGLTILGIGLLTVGLSAGAIYYFKTIALVGIIILIAGFVATIGVLIWSYINERKANKENIEFIEKAVKPVLPPEVKTQLFGTETTPGAAQAYQSDSTIKIVSDIKTNIQKQDDKLAITQKVDPQL